MQKSPSKNINKKTGIGKYIRLISIFHGAIILQNWKIKKIAPRQ